MLEHLHGASMFMPHGHCYLWTPPLLWLMVLSDALIAVSYFAIPVMLLYFTRSRSDLPFRGVFYLFMAFITLCGVTHAWDIYTTWVPAYWVEGLLKGATGLVSLATAIALWPILPRALALKSPAELAAANATLARTVEQLEAANARLAESERLKSRLLENLSHELRTPLTLVKAPTEALLSGELGDAPDGWPAVLRSIQANTARLEDIVRNAFELARLDAGELSPVVHPTDVRAIVEDLVEDFRRIGAASGVDVVVDEMDVPRRVMLDRYLFERVLFNLVSNGVKFTPRGGAVRCGLRSRGDVLELVVSDDGPGIPPEQQDAVFQRFHQVDDTRTRSHDGAGLGLALVAEVVSLLSGRVVLRSSPDEGTRFVVTLPAPETEDDGQHAPPRLLPPPVTFAPVPRLDPPTEGAALPRILLAEDNADMAALVCSILEPALHVETVGDGRQALASVHASPPDVVISDVMMPVLDGLSLCRSLKEDPRTRDIPVLLLSARGGREAVIEAWSVGADEYLFKPFHPRELRVRVRTLLDAARSRRQAIAQRARAEQAEASARELAALTAALSHDVAAPLRIIDQTLAILPLADSPEERATIIQAVRERVKVLQGLTTELLGWLRTGRMDEPARPLAFAEVVELARALVDIPGGFSLTVTGGAVPMEVPPTAAAQCIGNLLRNALQHHDRSEGAVLLEARAVDGGVEVRVEDDGPGVPPAVRERVFELFAAGPDGGTGVGLAFVHRVTRRLGGRVALEDMRPRGLRVLLWWPAALGDPS